MTTTQSGQRGGGRQPVDSKTRALVRKLARSGLSRNEVARRSGVSTYSVSKICADASPPITFDRRAIAAATEAKIIDHKARRAAISGQMLDLVGEFQSRMFKELTVRTTDGQGTVITYTVDPTARDWKDTMTAIGISIDKHLAIVRIDSDDRDLPAVDQWLAAMMGATK